VDVFMGKKGGVVDGAVWKCKEGEGGFSRIIKS